MKLGGLQKTTLIDYPGTVACTVFTIGCNFRCPFCHNPELVLPEKTIREKTCQTASALSEKEFFEFLEERKEFLTGVVICGGEPTIYLDLPEFCKKIKQLGFLVKLDTNGSNPDMLNALIKSNLVDYVAMDVKSSKEKYSEVAGVDIDIENIDKSIEILKQGNVDCEFRTTIMPSLHSKADIIKLASWISGASKYYLQNFQSGGKTVNPTFKTAKQFSKNELEGIRKAIEHNFDICGLR